MSFNHDPYDHYAKVINDVMCETTTRWVALIIMCVQIHTISDIVGPIVTVIGFACLATIKICLVRPCKTTKS